MKKHDATTKKLQLKRETLRPLNAEALDGIQAGIGPTITLTTVTTVAASHPIVTCGGGWGELFGGHGGGGHGRRGGGGRF